MDFSSAWKQLLSQSADIQGGGFFSADGVLFSAANFGTLEDQEIFVAHCAALVAIARQLTKGAECGEFDSFVLEGNHGYLVLMPVLDKAILAALIRKQAKLGLVLLDMMRAIDDTFGPGLAGDPISPSKPPKAGTAHARPETD